MEYRLLGGTGVRVSKLCFGTMPFGGDVDESTAAVMFKACRDRGINFFDTADVYGKGRAEEILGRLIRGSRDELVISSKVFGRTGEDVNARGLSHRHIVRAVEASLRRLVTDRIDVYFFHGYDTAVPMEESLRAMDRLVAQGKILYAAVSNWSAWQIAKGLGISREKGLAAFQCIQPMYNLVKRQAEVEILPLARSEGIGVISYSPLGGGLLSGKYGLHPAASSGRLQTMPGYRKRYEDPAYFEVARRFAEHAKRRSVHPVSLAVAWVMSHPAITAPIIGARSLEQLEPALASVDVEMTPEWRREISSLSPAPPPATDRSEEPRPDP